MPSACSAAGLALEIIPVALTTSRPAGMLRVTSSLRRSVCAARSFSMWCSRSSSFSWSRNFWMTPCIEAAMKAEGFCVRGACGSSTLWAFRAFRKYRLTRNSTTKAMASNPTPEATPNAQRFGGLAACRIASLMSAFMSSKHLRPARQYLGAKIHHQQRGDSQERPERELIFAGDGPAQGLHAAKAATAGALRQSSLPPRGVERNDDGETDQRSHQRTQQDGQERSAHAKERSHHRHHLHVAHTHAFAAANPLVGCRYRPKKEASERRTQQCVEQALDRPRGHSTKQCGIQKNGGAIVGWHNC